jgi:hypothetical protein
MTYPEFWLHYLRAHRDPRTRAIHYAGTVLANFCLLAAIVWLDWRLLVLAPIVGYAAAWVSHFGIEGNKPATFGHPLWSLVSDYRMLGLFLAGQLGPHLQRAGIA